MTPLDPVQFRRKLMIWYRRHARVLPWRGIADPYRTWVSEVMLQQTRVAAVIDHYRVFLERFPTLEALAAATEPEVLAVWSGLGYYRRARMLHRAARFVIEEWHGHMPQTAAQLLKLPGVGAYTSAAIASIAFGESVAVVDGNVERVLLRIAGRSEDATADGRALIARQADALVPPTRKGRNAPGDHNQAMMELGATICLPRAPLCLQCPVYALCATRGPHTTSPRVKPKKKGAAYLLDVEQGTVLLRKRPANASLMAGMYELPPLPLDAVEGLRPELCLRQSITDTVYLVSIYRADERLKALVATKDEEVLHLPLRDLPHRPLTGLARKVLRRLEWMP